MRSPGLPQAAFTAIPEMPATVVLTVEICQGDRACRNANPSYFHIQQYFDRNI
jgi:hypothetical protein